MTGAGPRRTALVTGAGSPRGIGRATARRLAAAGWDVAVLDIDGDAAEETARIVAAEYGISALGLPADVTDADDVDQSITEIETRLPPVEALVNNAGISSPSTYLDISRAEWDRIFAVNVTGTHLVTRRIVPGMRERGGGRIVCISSVSAQRGGGVFGGVHYSASKAAVQGFARALARELAPDNIRVNAVTPALIDTDLTAGRISSERLAAVVATVPLGRVGRASEVAAVVNFLLSDEASYITGATYDINGGSLIH